MLAQGCSLEEIGRRVERAPSTVWYWLRKYGLEAAHAAQHANRGGIDEAVLRALVERGLSTRAIAAEVCFSFGAVRHWLKAYGLDTRDTLRRQELARARASGASHQILKCPRCGPAAHRRVASKGYVCIRCRARSVADRRRKVKAILVAEAGGECVLCGFDGSQAALQFHHLDPTTKSFHISSQGVTRSIERAREEVRKCILLCANCHAAVECGDAALP